MHSRRFASISLLVLLVLLLAGCAIVGQERPTLRLTPPPLASVVVRVGPEGSAPTSPLTITDDLSETALVTESALITDTSGLTAEAAITATPVAFMLPTITPTPLPEIALVPTATPTAMSALILTPTATVALPNVASLTTSLPITSTGSSTGTLVGAQPRYVSPSVPLPDSYQAEGTFASQTLFADGTMAQQEGNFTILQAAARNAYGVNQHYMLRTQRAVGVVDEINVYQIDDYVAVNYTDSDWMLVRRDQGSNIVRAIQPITDLAILFPRIIDQAELVGPEEIGGVSTLRYRVNDPAGQAARLIQPLLALTGEIRSLTLDVWIAVPGGYVASYNFQVELAGARVLDTELNEVQADQAVTWTYELAPIEAQPSLVWPLDAPRPDAFPIPGFAAGAFPLPPNTELIALVSGMPDLYTTSTMQEVDSFYRTELVGLGWTVEGEGGLLRCSKEGTNFQLLITADTTSEGTRISILPAE